MKKERLGNLIQQGENERIEFKETGIFNDKKEIAGEMIAFANRNGGIILFGVKDNQEIEGATIDFDKRSLDLSNIANDMCSPAVEFTSDMIHFPDGDVLVVDIPRRRGIPHAVVNRSDHEIRSRKYYIRTVNGKRLVNDHELAHLFSEIEDPHLSYPFRISITYLRKSLKIPAIEAPKYINYFGPLLNALEEKDRIYLLEKELEDIGEFFAHLAPYAMLKYLAWIFPGSWLSSQHRRIDITTILPLRVQCGKKIINLNEIPICGNSFLSQLSTDFEVELGKVMNQLCVPPETDIQIVHEYEGNSKVCALEITCKRAFDFRFIFAQTMWTKGLPFGHPQRARYERMEIPYEEVKKFEDNIATVGLNSVFRARYGFPDIEDPLFYEHLSYGKTIQDSIKQDWDWDNFISQLPEKKLYTIEDKLNDLLFLSNQIISSIDSGKEG